MPRLIRKAVFLTKRVEKLLRKNGSKLPADVRARAEAMLAELRDGIRLRDHGRVRAGLQELRPLQRKYFPGAHKPVWRSTVEFLSLAFVVAFFLRTFVIAAFTIPTSSMSPTLAPGDVILVWRSAFGVTLPFTNHQLLKVRSPRRWEVAVFTTKDLPVSKNDRGKAFIKRIVGLPGEEIEIRNGEVYVNGKIATKPPELSIVRYVRKGFPAFDNAPAIKVPDGMYFVLGDNTNDSEDSRFWGFLPEHNIRGRAFVVFFPRSRIHWL